MPENSLILSISILNQILFFHLPNMIDCHFKRDKNNLDSNFFINKVMKLNSCLLKPHNELSLNPGLNLSIHFPEVNEVFLLIALLSSDCVLLVLWKCHTRT